MDFEKIYRLYFKDIYHYVYSLCGNESITEEVAQETFYKALRSIDRFDGSRDIRAWLFTIAKNTYFSLCRKKRRTTDAEPAPDTEASPDLPLADQITDEDRAFRIHRFLHTMPEPDKEVFTLRVFGELPFEKIGAIFGKTAGWARVTFHRAKQQIQKYMEETEHEDQL